MFNTRVATLDDIYRQVTKKEFDTILGALESGQIASKAYCIALLMGQDCVRKDNKKHTLTTEEWASCALSLSEEKGIHLVDSQNDQAHTEITLSASDVNRVLKLTSQNGGEQPKMGPKVYAFLAAGFANGDIDPSSDPEVLFTDLEDRADLWDNRGPITQNRGIAAIKEFLTTLAKVDLLLLNDTSIYDISFASEE